MTNPDRERVDIIDEDGNTVDVATRRDMRERRLPHRCVYVLVFDARGRLFVHLRTATKDVFPSHWDVTIGGVLSAGESFAAGVVRETAEELGIDVAEPEELFPFRYEDEKTIVQALVYRLVHEGPFRLQAEEIVRGEFIERGELPARRQALPFCPDGLAVYDLYEKRESSGAKTSLTR